MGLLWSSTYRTNVSTKYRHLRFRTNIRLRALDFEFSNTRSLIFSLCCCCVYARLFWQWSGCCIHFLGHTTSQLNRTTTWLPLMIASVFLMKSIRFGRRTLLSCTTWSWLTPWSGPVSPCSGFRTSRGNLKAETLYCFSIARWPYSHLIYVLFCSVLICSDLYAHTAIPDLPTGMWASTSCSWARTPLMASRTTSWWRMWVACLYLTPLPLSCGYVYTLCRCCDAHTSVLSEDIMYSCTDGIWFVGSAPQRRDADWRTILRRSKGRSGA